MKRLTLFILLVLTVSALGQKPNRGAEYRTTSAFTYGKFEVRMKSIEASGLLSSFFLYYEPVSDPIGTWNEIDIEILGRYNDEIQFNIISPGQLSHEYEHPENFNPHTGFHVYGIIWMPEYIAWTVDGFEVHRQTGSHVEQIVRPMKLMMNVWQPNYPGWVGPFDPNDNPQYAFYDWVKVYAYTPGENDNFTMLWEDDFSEFNVFRWARGTHTWDGNNTQFTSANAIFQDGYLVLCHTSNTSYGYSGEPIVDVDNVAPYVREAWAYDDTVAITFNEELDPQSAENLDNYTTTGLTKTGAELQPDGRTALLSVEGRDPEVSYNVVTNAIGDLAEPQNISGLKNTVIKNVAVPPLRYNSGGIFTENFLGDQEYMPGYAYGHAGGSSRTITASVSADRYEEIYTSASLGLYEFTAMTPPGVYDITFFFVEPQFTEAGSRVFDIAVNGEIVLEGLDIFAEAGVNTALEKTVTGLNITGLKTNIAFLDRSGEAILSGLEFNRTSLTSVQTETSRGAAPEGYRLDVYPNPFNPETNIAVTLPEAAEVTVTIIDMLGSEVATLASDHMTAGSHVFRWQPQNIGSGIYLCSIVAGHKALHRKMLYLK